MTVTEIFEDAYKIFAKFFQDFDLIFLRFWNIEIVVLSSTKETGDDCWPIFFFFFFRVVVALLITIQYKHLVREGRC